MFFLSFTSYGIMKYLLQVQKKEGYNDEMQIMWRRERKISFVQRKRSILSELAKLLKISVTDDYKGMGFQQITQ